MCLGVVLRQVFIFYEFYLAQIAAKYLSQNNTIKAFPLCPIILDFPPRKGIATTPLIVMALVWSSTQLGPGVL